MRKMSFAFKVSLILSYTIILIRDTNINYVRLESNIICHGVGKKKDKLGWQRGSANGGNSSIIK